eukprot:GHVQ01017314.1.p1 GENE.GHVQ01017314.1~~GHVQ01017314.1.p1  ORF type:complete len:511 (+),score=40.86 GHVQ01017314.1:389-1921(+)
MAPAVRGDSLSASTAPAGCVDGVIQSGINSLQEIDDKLQKKFHGAKPSDIFKWDISNALFKSDTPSLPQDSDAADRKSRECKILERQERYQYDYETNIPGAPYLMSHGPKGLLLPHEQRTTLLWKFLLVSRVLDVFAGDKIKDIVDDIHKLLHKPDSTVDIFELFINVHRNGPQALVAPATCIRDYEELFDDDEIKPQTLHELSFDEAFCRLRLSGYNPMALSLCTKHQLNKVAVESITDKVIQQRIRDAFGSRRLFVTDFSILSTIESGQYKDYKKYSLGPIALFEIPLDKSLREAQSIIPLCIQCEPWNGLIEDLDPPAVFTPNDDIMDWNIAKLILNSADVAYHDAIEHLAHTHLVVESFLVATYRQLSDRHPLFKLLEPHFEGTANINNMANVALVKENGPLDQILSQNILALDIAVGQKVQEILNCDLSFPARLKARQMDCENFIAPFPYRDDGLLIWNAIEEWVRNYISVYYIMSVCIFMYTLLLCAITSVRCVLLLVYDVYYY